VFESPDDPDTSMRRLRRLIKDGHLYDASHLKNVLQETIGDVTFQEAYNRSRIVLNITVSSSTTYEMPCLLNYLTAPDVVSLRKSTKKHILCTN
jgi:TAG lipase/steryl ester hydrolase/phospholipase A2/LPA acyltransferase